MVQKRTHCISNLQIALSPKLCSNLKLNTLKSHNAVHETKGDEETQNTVDETNGLHCYSRLCDFSDMKCAINIALPSQGELSKEFLYFYSPIKQSHHLLINSTHDRLQD
jgi:hypothetical protein